MGYLGFDIGGTKCAVILAQCRGSEMRFYGRREFPTNHAETPETMILRLCEAGRRLLADNGAHMEELQGIGISCGGPLDSAAGVILSPPNLSGWDNVEIVKMAEAYFHAPAGLLNDANAGALAEWRFGAGQGCDSMVFLTLGTGCGAGLILNGELYEGATGNAGECGHIRLERYGPPGYGKCGSMEGFCSGAGIAALGKLTGTAYMQSGKATSLERYIKEGTLTAKIIADKAREQDAAAVEVFRTAGRQLGRGLAVLIDILDIEKIVLGGMYMRCRDLVEEEMLRAIKEECLSVPAQNCRIVPALLNEKIGDYAAIAAALQSKTAI